jgi:hypothetical protein
MNQSFQIKLDTVDVFQLLDGLKSKAESWRKTERFLQGKNLIDGEINIMPISDLTEHEKNVMHECLRAVAHGPFFIDKNAHDPFLEFQTMFGLSINELRGIAEKWPEIEMASEKVKLAINNSMNNLLGYPHGPKNKTWSQYISVSPEEVSRIFLKWRGGNSKD